MDEQDRTLVFVDDEPNILSALKRSFFDEDYEIETFTDPRKALEFIESNKVHLIISDQRMPIMEGTEFLAKSVELDPAPVRIILTGYADLEAAVDAINRAKVYRFIFKPWNDDDIRITVQRALEFYDLEQQNKRLLGELKEKNAELEEWNQTLNQKVKERTALIASRNLELAKVTKVLEKSIVNTVKVFLKLMESMDPTLTAHSRRIAYLATSIAAMLEFSEQEISDLEIAALLHDIGKLGLPKKLLDSPMETLQEKDRQLVMSLPQVAQSYLKEIEWFDRAGKIVRHINERWDGRGHPDNLAGEDIPLESRLLAVCNQYDELSAIGGKSEAFIIKFFKTNAGTRFDADMSKALLSFVQAQSKTKHSMRRQVDVLASELMPGMVLVNDLFTENGIFLLPKGQKLEEKNITSIREIQKVDPIPGSIRVVITDGDTES